MRMILQAPFVALSALGALALIRPMNGSIPSPILAQGESSRMPLPPASQAQTPRIEVMVTGNEVFRNWYRDQFGYSDSNKVTVERLGEAKETDRLRVRVHSEDQSGVDLLFVLTGDGKTTPACEVSGSWRMDNGPHSGAITPVRGLVTVNKLDMLDENPLQMRFAVLVDAGGCGMTFLHGAFTLPPQRQYPR